MLKYFLFVCFSLNAHIFKIDVWQNENNVVVCFYDKHFDEGGSDDNKLRCIKQKKELIEALVALKKTTNTYAMVEDPACAKTIEFGPGDVITWPDISNLFKNRPDLLLGLISQIPAAINSFNMELRYFTTRNNIPSSVKVYHLEDTINIAINHVNLKTNLSYEAKTLIMEHFELLQNSDLCKKMKLADINAELKSIIPDVSQAGIDLCPILDMILISELDSLVHMSGKKKVMIFAGAYHVDQARRFLEFSKFKKVFGIGSFDRDNEILGLSDFKKAFSFYN